MRDTSPSDTLVVRETTHEELVYRDRLKIAAAYGELLTGKVVLEQDLGDPRDGVFDHSLEQMLGQLGLDTHVQHCKETRPEDWPAVARMKDGQLALVLGQTGGVIEVYNPLQDGRSELIDHASFAAFFDGELIKAENSSDALDLLYASDTKEPHWFWSVLMPHKSKLWVVGFGSLISNALAVSIALFALQVYDRVLPHEATATLWVLVVGVMAAILLEGMLKFARARLVDRAGVQIDERLSAGLMRNVLGMRLEGRRVSDSAMMNAVRDLGSIREFFTTSVISGVIDLPFVLVFLLLVWAIGGSAVLVLILGGAIMVAPSLLFRRRLMALTSENMQAGAHNAIVLQEAVTNLENLRAYGGEMRFQRMWEDTSQVLREKGSRQRRLSSLLTLWAQGAQQAVYVATIATGAYMVFAGTLTLGSVIAMSILSSRTLAPLAQFSTLLSRSGNVRAALDGLGDIAASPQVRVPGRAYLRRPDLAGQYVLRDLQFAYDPDGARDLYLDGVMIKPNQTVALLGASGAGKTTLLKVLAGLYAPTAGQLQLDSVDISQIDPADLRRNIAYMSQQTRLFPGTLRDNLRVGAAPISDERLYKALEFAQLSSFVRSHPSGLDLQIGEGGRGLSVGQAQAVMWARIWLADPKILLLDEPTAALDPTTEDALLRKLRSWFRGRTVVVATHRMALLPLCERALVMHHGQIVVDGPREQVLDRLSKAA